MTRIRPGQLESLGTIRLPVEVMKGASIPRRDAGGRIFRLESRGTSPCDLGRNDEVDQRLWFNVKSRRKLKENEVDQRGQLKCNEGSRWVLGKKEDEKSWERELL